MITLKRAFDGNGDGKIRRQEYESNDKAATEMRTRRLQNVKFDQFDVDKDKLITAEDFRQLIELKYKLILEKIAGKDAEWIWKNCFRVSTEWIDEHFKLEANKTRRSWIFMGHDHDLNFLNWVLGKKMPDGISAMSEVTDQFNN